MHPFIDWIDQLSTDDDLFLIKKEGVDEDGNSIVRAVSLAQVERQGTAFASFNMKNTEHSLFSLFGTAAELARQAQHQQQATDMLEGEVGEVVLKNSASFPFNNSQKSVALTESRMNTGYYVVVEEAVATSGGFVGDVVVSGKQKNGFIIQSTGSAPEVRVRYRVTGGRK